eukprot:GHRR01009388.1.p1 GENE.GHRR01009388.1~~GHRR01009388.1.p1  ORF type:complete len:818 (+),score=319.97 GHRR01009388.1:195-2456(+)
MAAADSSSSNGALTQGIDDTAETRLASNPVVNDRLVFCAEVLIGHKCEVQLVDGLIIEGIFHTMKVDGKDTHVVLKYAKVIKDPASKAEDLQAIAKKPDVVKLIHSNDIAAIVAKDVRMAPEDLGAEQYDLGFETDAAISRGRGGLINRELVAWMPDPDDGSDATMFGLEDSHEPGWDQFAVNQRKFGYQTGWNEDYYTVKLDKTKCGIDEDTAARIAREIERGDTSNPHLAEERGQELDDSGLDEEDKYSGVIRPEDVPHFRQQQQQNGALAQQQQQQQINRPAAWSRAGSGISAVAGGYFHQQQPQQPMAPPGIGPLHGNAVAAAGPLGAPPGLPPPVSIPSAPVSIPARSGSGSSNAALVGSAPGLGSSPASMSGSAPRDIDPRREANKVRLSLTGASLNKNRSSPYGTPKGLKSPLLSPLISDPLKVAALNLEPGVTKVDDDTRKEFLKYKAQLQAQRDAAAAQSALSSALQTSSKLVSSPTAAAATAAGTPTAAAAASSTAQAVAAELAELAAAPAAAAAATTEAKPAAADIPPKPKPASKLNPNAKPFTFNINAKPFVPGGPSSTASSTAAAPAASASAGSNNSAVSAVSAGAGGHGAVLAANAAGVQQVQQQQTGSLPMVMPVVPVGLGVPPGLGLAPGQAQHMAGHAGSAGTVLAMGIPAGAAPASGGPPPGLAPLPGRLAPPPPPISPGVTGKYKGCGPAAGSAGRDSSWAQPFILWFPQQLTKAWHHVGLLAQQHGLYIKLLL